MPEKDKEQAPQAPAQEQPQANDHSSLVDALKQAFAKETIPTEVKKGMDETIPGGKYVNLAGQLVNAHGEPIDESGRKLKKD